MRPRKRIPSPETAVPILMYHVIGTPPVDAPFPELFVAPGTFDAHLTWLARHGYSAVTLRTVWNHWRHGAPLPDKPVVISFDDGFRDTAQIALPRLRSRGWPGVLNLALHHLDVSWGLSSRQIRSLVAAGWEIGAHTLTHPDLTYVDEARLHREVAGSKRRIERRFGVRVDFFCYPSGRYDGRVVAAVERAGFFGATTTVSGLARSGEAYVLRRLRVNRSDGVGRFAANLRAAR